MKPLPPSMTVTPGSGESVTSTASRNAYLLGRSVRHFSLDMGFNFQGLVDGEQSTIAMLARRMGVDVEPLAANAITKIGERRYEFRGQALVRASLSRSVLRACPHCLMRDLDERRETQAALRPFGRTVWLIDSIRTCPEHDLGLIAVSTASRAHRVHDFAVLIQPSLPNLAGLAKEAPARQPSAFERFLLARCDGSSGADAAFLAGLSFYAAARACEMIGAIATHGPRFTADKLSDADWHEAGAVGFDIATGGEDGIRSFLTGLQDRFVMTKGDWGLRLVFGRLYEWLAYESDDPAYEPLRDIITRHVMETMPVGPGDEIFGREVAVRRLHSVRSAATEFALHPKRLRKVLRAGGHITQEAMVLTDDRILFDAVGVREFLGRVADTISLKQAGEYLNAPRPQEKLLFDAGFIQPVVRGGSEGIHGHAFARRDLDAFLGRLLANATDAGPDNTTLLPIPAAAKRACCSAMEIVALILDGMLSRIGRDRSTSGYLSVLVDPDEVKPFVRGTDIGGLTLREVERALASSTAVVKALVELGHLPSCVRMNPVKRCPQRVVSQVDLDAFTSRYTSLHSLARETGIHFRKLSGMLRRAGIHPAFDPHAVKASFYERKELPD